MVRDHDKQFKAIVVPQGVQNDVLYEGHIGLGHNGSMRLYQFICAYNHLYYQ